jgi:hypothetical protein
VDTEDTVSPWLSHTAQITSCRSIQPFPHLALAPSFASLLECASLRGPYVLSIRLYRRFPALCAVTYNAGPFQGQGTVWNLSCTSWRLSGDLPMRPGEILSLAVTLPNEQRIEVPEAVVRWSRGEEFGIETIEVPKQTTARLTHYVRRLVKNPIEILRE